MNQHGKKMWISAVAIAVALSMLSTAFVFVDSDDSYADPAAEKEYHFYLLNTVSGEDSTINGWYVASGTTVIEAFCKALDARGVSYTGFSASDSSVAFSATKYISNWTKGEWASDGDLYYPNYAIWNYNETKGWYMGQTFGMDSDTIYLISHERYVDIYGPTAASLGVDLSKIWPQAGQYLKYDGTTGGYANVDAAAQAAFKEYKRTYSMPEPSAYGLSNVYATFEEAFSAYYGNVDLTKADTSKLGPGWDVSNMAYGSIQKGPQDATAGIADMVFGDMTSPLGSPTAQTEYFFYLYNTVAGTDASINGWHSARGSSVIDAFVRALDGAGIAHPGITGTEADVVFGATKYIADCVPGAWAADNDKYNPNYAIWNYNDTQKWHLGNTFGQDSDNIYLISFENYLNPYGPTGAQYGVDTTGVYADADASEYFVYDGTTGGYKDVEEATHNAFADYVANYFVVDGSKYGLTTVDPSSTVEDEMMSYFADCDLQATDISGVATGWDVNLQWSYMQMTPVDATASVSEMRYGIMTSPLGDPEAQDEYSFYLYSSVPNKDTTANGWHTARGSSVVDAFVKALDQDKVAHPGIVGNEEKISFSATKYVSDWVKGAWGNNGDLYNPAYTIWNYNDTDKWIYSPTSFGKSPDKTYLISYEQYVVSTGPTAETIGADLSAVYPKASAYFLYDGSIPAYATVDDSAKAAYREYNITLEIPTASDYGLEHRVALNNIDEAAKAAYVAYRNSWGYLMPDPADYGLHINSDDMVLSLYISDVDLSKMDFSNVVGYDLSYAQWGSINLGPQDYKAAPEQTVFGADYALGPFMFTVQWISEGKVLEIDEVASGDTVTYDGATPTKAGTKQVTYTFDKWDGYTVGMKITSNTVFNALFTSTVNGYDVDDKKEASVKVDNDSSTISSSTVNDVKADATSGKINDFKIELKTGSITLDKTAIGSLSGNVDASVKNVDKADMSEAVKKVAGDRPVYDINLGNKHEFNGGKLTISLPYTLAEGEDAKGVFIYYIDVNGNATKVNCDYADGQVTFTVDHLSTYAIMYEEPASEKNTALNGIVIGLTIAIILIASFGYFALTGKQQ